MVARRRARFVPAGAVGHGAAHRARRPTVLVGSAVRRAIDGIVRVCAVASPRLAVDREGARGACGRRGAAGGDGRAVGSGRPAGGRDAVGGRAVLRIVAPAGATLVVDATEPLAAVAVARASGLLGAARRL